MTKLHDSSDDEDNVESKTILQEYWDVVTNEQPSQLPSITQIAHNIELLAGNPPARPPYSLSRPEQKTMQEEIESLLSKGYIEPSVSPYSAPVWFVEKSDKTLRMCIDYQLLNQKQ